MDDLYSKDFGTSGQPEPDSQDVYFLEDHLSTEYRAVKSDYLTNDSEESQVEEIRYGINKPKRFVIRGRIQMIKTIIDKSHRIRQGDIFKDIEYIEYVVVEEGNIEASIISFPLVIVLTQDCDLNQDYDFRMSQKAKTQDKILLSVLVAPLYNADHVSAGEHLSELQMNMEPINLKTTPGKYLLQNDRPRYHYLAFPSDSALVPAVVDFKHYFSVNGRYLESKLNSNFVCSVSPLYRESISQRFANFLSRIGLPAPDSKQENVPPPNH